MTTRKPGRPKELQDSETITVYLDGESSKILGKLIKQWKISRSAVIRKLLKQW